MSLKMSDFEEWWDAEISGDSGPGDCKYACHKAWNAAIASQRSPGPCGKHPRWALVCSECGFSAADGHAHSGSPYPAKKCSLCELERERDMFRLWASCGGVPIGRKCYVDGHDIYGPFLSDEKGDICECHMMQRSMKERDQLRKRLEVK